MKRSLFVLLLSLFALFSNAQDDSQTEYTFLRLPVSAHAAAMGGDNITMPDDDALMMFHNPALIIGATPKTVSLQYMRYIAGCNSTAAAYNMVFDDKWYVGAGIQYMGYGSMRQTDSDNNDLGTFSANDIALQATLGYELARNLSGGITLRGVYGSIGAYNSLAVAADLGLNLYTPESEWSVSIVAKNLGGQIKAYDEDFEKMPLDLQVGVSKRLIGSPLRLSLTLVDLNHTGYSLKDHMVIGAEALLSDQIYVAGGYNFRRAHDMKVYDGEGNNSSHGAGLSFGAGVNLERVKINIAYSKLHVSASTLIANIAFTL